MTVLKEMKGFPYFWRWTSMLWQLLSTTEIALFAPFVDSARGADRYKVTLPYSKWSTV